MKKSDGVFEVVEWMKAELKKQKAVVDEANKHHSSIATVGDFYDECRREEEIRLRTMVSWMVSTEKYAKKLRHEGQ